MQLRKECQGHDARRDQMWLKVICSKINLTGKTYTGRPFRR